MTTTGKDSPDSTALRIPANGFSAPTFRPSLLLAGITDHLQTSDAEITGFLGFGFLAFFCLTLCFFGFFCLRFVVTSAGYGHRMPDVLGQLDGAATQFPGLAVLASDCKFIRFVALLQAAGHRNRRVHGLGSSLCGCCWLLPTQRGRAKDNERGCNHPE